MYRRQLIVAMALMLFVSGGILANPLKQDPGADGIVSVEAENYDENTPQGGGTFELVGPTGGFTGIAGMQGTGGSTNNTGYAAGSPRLDFQVQFVKTGTHYVWVRAWGAGGGDDSCHAGLNGEEIDTCDRMSGFNNNYRWSNDTMDPERSSFEVPSAGEHTLNIWMRENGLIIDKIVLTTNPDYVPTGDGPPESNRGASLTSSGPSPEDAAVDVPYYAGLSWTPGDFAAKHHVYFGTDFDDVNEASLADPRGVLVSEGQTGTSYQPELILGTTYYWRVDDVNTAPPFDVHQGIVWSFTLEPVTYPVANVTATASASHGELLGPGNTVDGSGLTGDLHGTNDKTMWLAPPGFPVWIQFEFDSLYMLQDMQVWNQNQLLEPLIGLSAKDVVVETSAGGEVWKVVEGATEFARAPGTEGYAPNTTVDLDGVMAKFVKVTINSSHGILNQAGLSEVRFNYIPAFPREFSPANGTDLTALEVPLSWRAGRFATEHQVFFSNDVDAIADGSALITTTLDRNYTITDLDYGLTYLWQIADVAADGRTFAGPVNICFAPHTGIIDDMEMYKDEEFLEIWSFWVDGYNDNSNGSIVGNGSAPEEVEVYEGSQSMPMTYDNSSAPKSEATQTFDPPINLLAGNADTIGVYFKGVPFEFNGYYSQDGGGFWTAMSWNPQTVVMSDDALIGLAVTSHNVDTPTTVVFSEVETTGGVTGAWTQADVGGTHPAGLFSEAGGTFTIRAMGSDIWNAADEFRYVYKNLSGEGSLAAKVDSLETVDNWTKAGVMIRDAAVPDASFAAVYATGVNGVRYQARLENGINAVSDTGVLDGTQELLDEPVWVKIERKVVNGAAEVYLKFTDTSNNSVLVPHPDPSATRLGNWTLLSVPLSDLAGINASSVKSISVGVQGSGAVGKIYVDYLHFNKDLAVDNPVNIWREAESADTLGVSWRLVDDPNASGGQRIGSEDDDGNDNGSPPDPNWIAVYNISVPETGVYNVVLRGQEAGSDSFWVRFLDAAGQNVESPAGNGWVRFNGMDAPVGYTWDKVHSDEHSNTIAKWVLPAGPLTMEIGKREDGVYLDAILVTNELGLDQAMLPEAIPVP